jgi:hypothetical protein
MLYRGFRITDESTSTAAVFGIYETFRGNWRLIATANAMATAEAVVDQTLLGREVLLGGVMHSPAD